MGKFVGDPTEPCAIWALGPHALFCLSNPTLMEIDDNFVPVLGGNASVPIQDGGRLLYTEYFNTCGRRKLFSLSQSVRSHDSLRQKFGCHSWHR